MYNVNMLNNIEIKKRLLLKVEVDTSGCWLWTGGKLKGGYGHISVNAKGFQTHRLSYELFKGPISEGMCVCHSCDKPACINPDHLWVGTHQENMIDKVIKRRDGHSTKTHCPKGHEYSKENTYIYNNGRRCKKCTKDKALERYYKSKSKSISCNEII